MHLAGEGQGPDLEEVGRRLAELLLDWEKGVRTKTSGTAFAAWQNTLSAARHFVKIYQPSRPEKRARLEFPTNVSFWQKPVNFVELGRGMRDLFGEDDVRSIVVFLAQMYLLCRKLLELHRASELSAQDFSFSNCNVLGFCSWNKVMRWSCRANPGVQYRVRQEVFEDEVTFLNSCKLLRLHCVDSVHDPVQVQTRNNILRCSTESNAMDHSRTILRAVMVVHATRHVFLRTDHGFGPYARSDLDIWHTFVGHEPPALPSRAHGQYHSFLQQAAALEGHVSLAERGICRSPTSTAPPWLSRRAGFADLAVRALPCKENMAPASMLQAEGRPKAHRRLYQARLRPSPNNHVNCSIQLWMGVANAIKN